MQTKLTSCDGDFWYICTVHFYERPNMENVQVVPTMEEMISASMTFKRFYNGVAINGSDAYQKQIELILTGNVGLNYIQDLTYSSYMSKGEPFFDFLKVLPGDLRRLNKM